MLDKSHHQPIFDRFSTYFDLNAEEERLLNEIHKDIKLLPPGEILAQPSEPLYKIYLLLDGWAFGYRVLPSGERQIINYYLNHDFIGLSLLTHHRDDFYVACLTECKVCHIDKKALIELIKASPRLAVVIFSSVCNQNELLTEHIVQMSKNSAYHRTGHFLLELVNRLEEFTDGTLRTFSFPLNQNMLADTLGITPVHVNRTMQKLKNEGLIEYNNSSVTLLDREKLEAVTDFDSAYATSKKKREFFDESDW